MFDPEFNRPKSDLPGYLRLLRGGCAAALLTVLCACSTTPPAPTASAAGGVVVNLRHDDVLWLDRTGLDLDSQTLAQYRRLGRRAWLDQQLAMRNAPLPPEVQQTLGVAPDPLVLLAQVRARRRAIRALPQEQRAAARRALDAEGNRIAYESIRRELLRELYSPARLQEEMTWFWVNHFSVYEYKADLRWLVGDYVDTAIRPHALGHFRDLVMATLEHPAMLEYLDNDHNAAGHLNENYAREFMELHTLGVNAGYTQQDVQQLAHVFTGVGVNPGPAPRLPPPLRALYRRKGAFEFNPARHDRHPAVLLGHRLGGAGFDQVQAAVTLIVRQPACAQFISRQIATYFMGDDPPDALVAAMARTFRSTDGDIAAVLRTLLLSPAFDASLGHEYKDPTRYVLSAVRLSFPDRTINNTRPILNWLRTLGEGPFDHQTPDGYPLIQAGWASPGQLSRRFEVARAISSGNSHLFDPDAPPAATLKAGPRAAPVAGAGPALPAGGFAQPASRLYYAAIEPYLSQSTRTALAAASSPQEWNTFLLSSPDFNYE